MRTRLLLGGAALGASLLAYRMLPAQEVPAAEEAAPPPPPRLPRPTEHWLDPDAEARNSANRRAWVKEKKRARPGVSVDKLERAAGLAQIERRRQLRTAPPAGLGTWTERGSSNQSGRSHVVREVDGSLLVGSSLGGLWRGDPDGSGWAPLGDNLYGGVHWVEAPSGAIVVASERGLVHRSVDDGAVWDAVAGLGSPWNVRRLSMTSDGEETLYLTTGDDTGYQLFRSTDAGVNWTEIYDFAGFGGDFWVPRTGDSTLYVAAADGLYRSEDDGASFTAVSTWDAGSTTRAELVGSEAGAPRLWMMRDAVLSRSDDAGATWTEIGGMSDYWADLNASIVDPDLFTYGGVELHITRDAGMTFAIRNGWGDYYGDPATLLHADIQGVDVVPTDEGERWYINTDGGPYRSDDAMVNVQNLSMSGLRISQYYSTLTSSVDSSNVAAGAQDQGYQISNTAAQDGDDVYELTQIISGDYGHLTSSDGSHDLVYSVYPGFILVQEGEETIETGWGDFPPDSYVPWLPPIVADPEEKRGFFFPATRIWYYTYSRQSNYATGALYTDFNFSSDGYEYVSILRFAPTNPKRAYAATSYGRLFYSEDKGLNWTLSSSLVPDENWYYGQAMVVSPVDEKVVTVGGSGYDSPAVYRSEDGGVSFRPWGEGLPDTLVYSLCEAPDGSGRLVAGTETSVYLRGPDDDAWVDVTDNTAPITTYWSCEIVPGENTARFGTYGRGMWDYGFTPDEEACWPIVDGDGDGADCRTDCDDGDPAIVPGGTELCDGVETTCDPADLDEGDADGDGSFACADCDDLNAAVFPGAEERCGNSVDEDCDGEARACAVKEEEEEEEPGGCGCASGPRTALFPLLLILFVIRRRK